MNNLDGFACKKGNSNWKARHHLQIYKLRIIWVVSHVWWNTLTDDAKSQDISSVVLVYFFRNISVRTHARFAYRDFFKKNMDQV